MTSREADVAVVGAGVMGLAAAEALARSGTRVVVLEQFTPGHDRGSSHGSSRVFKVSYSDPEFVRLARTSLLQWRVLEAESGAAILTTTGSLDVGDLDGRREALNECGVECELLEPPEVMRRFGLTIDARATALFQPDGGVLHADRAQEALGDLARKNGAELAYETAARRLVVERDTVLVETSSGELRVRAVVVAAGAWVRRIVGPLGLEPNVVSVRETVAYFRPRVPDLPPPLSEWRTDDRQVTYGLVARDGLLKVGVSGSGSPADPDERGEIDRDVVRTAAAWAARHYDLHDETPVRAETCLYTNAPDERFIIERHGRLIVGSACSGHGFKFAPAVGSRLAELALAAAAS